MRNRPAQFARVKAGAKHLRKPMLRTPGIRQFSRHDAPFFWIDKR
ncbi:hypothetical protein RR11_1946 [Ruegeria sp. R11]|nr:hypothetical protein RR11_1946 [Ruegeria sp. R11]